MGKTHVHLARAGIALSLFVATARAGSYHTTCPYEAPVNHAGEFDIERILERELFPLLPDHLSVIGATGFTTGYRRVIDRSGPQTLMLSGRYGGPQLHPMLHFAGSIELPWDGGLVPFDDDQDDVEPRFDIGLGFHEIDGAIAGLVHYAYGIRVNLRGAVGDPPEFHALRRLDPDSGSAALRLTQELRIALAGCRAPFLHVTLEERSAAVFSNLISTDYSLPIKGMVGFFLGDLGLAAEVGYYYHQVPDSDVEDSIMTLRLQAEILGARGLRVGVAADTMFFEDPPRTNLWTAQIYAQWLPAHRLLP